MEEQRASRADAQAASPVASNGTRGRPAPVRFEATEEESRRIQALAGSTSGSVRLADPPAVLRADGAERDLQSVLAAFRGRSVFDGGLLREIAAAAELLPWVREVRRVSWAHREGQVCVAFDVVPRVPAAAVLWGGERRLVDIAGALLPAVSYHEEAVADIPWVQGVAVPPPAPGSAWGDPGLRAALDVLDVYARRGFAERRPEMRPVSVLVSLAPERGIARPVADPEVRLSLACGKQLLMTARGGVGRLSIDEQLHHVEDILADPPRWHRIERYADLRFRHTVPAQ